MGRRWSSAPPQPEPLLREPKKIETSVKGVGGWKPATKGSRCGEIFLICKRSGGGEKSDLFIRLPFALRNLSPLVVEEKGKRKAMKGVGGGVGGGFLLHWKVIALFDSLLSAIQKQRC